MDSDSGTRSPGGLWLIAAICSVVLIQVIYGILVFTVLGPSMEDRGQFGDIFGGVNALFTGLAFAGVIYTILLQRRELELQREELRLNRAELSRSAQAQMDQVDKLKEAADLSAMTALLNVYSTLLEPYWSSTQHIRGDIGHFKGELRRAGVDDERRRELEEDIAQRQEILKEQATEYIGTLRRHQKLVAILEAKFEWTIKSETSELSEERER